MIKKVKLENFKCFKNEEIEFRNLTILTGENSSGKSSLIQALLLIGNPKLGDFPYSAPDSLLINLYLESLKNLDDLVNKYTDTKSFKIEVDLCKYENISEIKNIYLIFDKINSEDNVSFKFSENYTFPNELTYSKNLFYLSADRTRVKYSSTLAGKNNTNLFGVNGEFASSYFYFNKSNVIENDLIKDDNSYTLENQVNFWLEAITGIKKLLINTEKMPDGNVMSYYNIDGFNFSPGNIGSGVSYVVLILILCLSAKKGDIIIIENPEIHLHPKSQAELGEFFAFVASKGIQLIIETHNDHIINKICYEQFKGNLKEDEVVIQYKQDMNAHFEKIDIKKGQFYNSKGENRFPEGFFDTTLKEIFAINEMNKSGDIC
jgi:predicted ATPase